MKLSKGCGPNLASIHKICHIYIIYGIYYVYKHKIHHFLMYIHIQFMCLYINAYIYWCMVEVLYQPQYTWSWGWYKTDTRLVLPGLLLSWYWYNAGIASWTHIKLVGCLLCVLIPEHKPIYQTNTCHFPHFSKCLPEG